MRKINMKKDKMKKDNVKKSIVLLLAMVVAGGSLVGCGKAAEEETTKRVEVSSEYSGNIVNNTDGNDEINSSDSVDNDNNSVSSELFGTCKYPQFADEYSVVAHFPNGVEIKTGMTKAEFLEVSDAAGWILTDNNDTRKLTKAKDLYVRTEGDIDQYFIAYFMKEASGTVTLRGFYFNSDKYPDVIFGDGLGFNLDFEALKSNYNLVDTLGNEDRPKYVFELATNLKMYVEDNKEYDEINIIFERELVK